MNPIVGNLTPWAKSHPGSPFLEFSLQHVHGLCYVDGPDIHFLSVVTTPHYRGHFRRFVRSLKEHYPFIRMWATDKATDPASFRAILTNYKFRIGHDVDKFGEMQEVFDWREKQPPVLTTRNPGYDRVILK